MEVVQEVIQQLVNGISLGSIYGLIALGYTMVYGIIRLINFAHGDIYMIGAFVGYFAIRNFNLSFLPALLVAMAVCAALGTAIERLAYRPLRNSTRIAAFNYCHRRFLFDSKRCPIGLDAGPQVVPGCFSPSDLCRSAASLLTTAR